MSLEYCFFRSSASLFGYLNVQQYFYCIIEYCIPENYSHKNASFFEKKRIPATLYLLFERTEKLFSAFPLYFPPHRPPTITDKCDSDKPKRNSKSPIFPFLRALNTKTPERETERESKISLTRLLKFLVGCGKDSLVAFPHQRTPNNIEVGRGGNKSYPTERLDALCKLCKAL